MISVPLPEPCVRTTSWAINILLRHTVPGTCRETKSQFLREGKRPGEISRILSALLSLLEPEVSVVLNDTHLLFHSFHKSMLPNTTQAVPTFNSEAERIRDTNVMQNKMICLHARKKKIT